MEAIPYQRSVIYYWSRQNYGPGPVFTRAGCRMNTVEPYCLCQLIQRAGDDRRAAFRLVPGMDRHDIYVAASELVPDSSSSLKGGRGLVVATARPEAGQEPVEVRGCSLWRGRRLGGRGTTQQDFQPVAGQSLCVDIAGAGTCRNRLRGSARRSGFTRRPQCEAQTPSPRVRGPPRPPQPEDSGQSGELTPCRGWRTASSQ